MKRRIKQVLFSTLCLIALFMPVKGAPVISGDLEGICIENYLLQPLSSKDRSGVSSEDTSKGDFLILELSVSRKIDKIQVFASRFLLISVPRDGFMLSSRPEAIRLCDQPLQMVHFSGLAIRVDHITLDKGTTDFYLLFYLAPEAVPIQLHYLGARDLACQIPYKLKLEMKHAHVF